MFCWATIGFLFRVYFKGPVQLELRNNSFGSHYTALIYPHKFETAILDRSIAKTFKRVIFFNMRYHMIGVYSLPSTYPKQPKFGTQKVLKITLTTCAKVVLIILSRLNVKWRVKGRDFWDTLYLTLENSYLF